MATGFSNEQRARQSCLPARKPTPFLPEDFARTAVSNYDIPAQTLSSQNTKLPLAPGLPATPTKNTSKLPPPPSSLPPLPGSEDKKTSLPRPPSSLPNIPQQIAPPAIPKQKEEPPGAPISNKPANNSKLESEIESTINRNKPSSKTPKKKKKKTLGGTSAGSLRNFASASSKSGIFASLRNFGNSSNEVKEAQKLQDDQALLHTNRKKNSLDCILEPLPNLKDLPKIPQPKSARSAREPQQSKKNIPLPKATATVNALAQPPASPEENKIVSKKSPSLPTLPKKPGEPSPPRNDPPSPSNLSRPKKKRQGGLPTHFSSLRAPRSPRASQEASDDYALRPNIRKPMARPSLPEKKDPQFMKQLLANEATQGGQVRVMRGSKNPGRGSTRGQSTIRGDLARGSLRGRPRGGPPPFRGDRSLQRNHSSNQVKHVSNVPPSPNRLLRSATDSPVMKHIVEKLQPQIHPPHPHPHPPPAKVDPPASSQSKGRQGMHKRTSSEEKPRGPSLHKRTPSDGDKKILPAKDDKRIQSTAKRIQPLKTKLALQLNETLAAQSKAKQPAGAQTARPNLQSNSVIFKQPPPSKPQQQHYSTMRPKNVPTRAPQNTTARSRNSIYTGLSRRQSTVLEQMDQKWSDVGSIGLENVYAEDESMDDDVLPELDSVHPANEETRAALASLNMEMPVGEVPNFNLEEPGKYEVSRKAGHTSIKPGVWEGWQRRVKRQTWEEWEQRMAHNRPHISASRKKDNKTQGHQSQIPPARPQQELDGRQVTPYWLIRWWLTKNTTDRPTVSKHPLLELILDNLNIVDAIADVTTGNDLNKLAYGLVCIFDGCGKIMTLITHFVTREIEATEHSNTLLRTNSITTKIISSYSKVAGVSFIRKLLSPLIQQLVDNNTAIEIDTKKTTLTGEDLALQQQSLLRVSQMFIDRIVNSLDIVPYSFRQICNCLRILISDKFCADTAYFGIGGFFFLRFICPSIVAPEAFGLLKSAPSKEVRRTLILVSKLIQNLANGIKQVKEEYMVECTNVLMKNNLQRMNEFYDKLAVIPPTLPEDDISVSALIPVPLIEEALTITHRSVIVQIDKIKEKLRDVDEVESVTYDVFENLCTVILKSNIILEHLRQHNPIPPSSPLFKPYSLLVDLILADGCKIVRCLMIQVPTTEKEEIAEALMTIVHQHGDAVHFVKSLISTDIEEAPSVEDALSGSSLPNLLFSGLLKVLTREFMMKYWAPYITKVNEDNECMELDPPRAPQNYDFMRANEAIAGFGTRLIDLLVENEQHIHQQAREICAYAQKKLMQRFGSNRIDPSYGVKLLFDRVFIPAVSYPKLFHLLPEFPQFHSRRTFILGSMILRNCLHNTLCDEGYLIGLNHVIKANSDKVKLLLRRVAMPVAVNNALQPTWEAQSEAIIVLHTHLSANQESLKKPLQGVTSSESIIYNVFDRLAAVIALYRFRLRRRIASGEYGEFNPISSEYSDHADRLDEKS